MSAEWYDLGLRLHAASTGTVADRIGCSPVLRATHPVAVRARASRVGEHVSVSVRACDRLNAPASATDEDALDLLGRLGVRIDAAVPATLVSDDAGTLRALRMLAGGMVRTGGESGSAVGTVASAVDAVRAGTAAHIGWWLDRADFPQGRAVVDVLSACRMRWVTGEAPSAERDVQVWRAWVGVGDEDVSGVLALYDAVTAGGVLAYLRDLADDDVYAWTSAQRAHADGWDWRRGDGLARAALGLRERCDAADLHAAGLLTDPQFRRRAVHTGHVVVGVAGSVSITPGRRVVDVICDRLDARVRPGKKVTGWSGAPDASDPVPFGAQVQATRVEAGALVVSLSRVSGAAPAVGDPVALHEAPPQVWGQRRMRKTLRHLYGSRSSWLTTGAAPVPARREVPLEVLVAAAESE